MQPRAEGMLKVAASPSLFGSMDAPSETALASVSLLLVAYFSRFFGNKVNLRDRKVNLY